MYNSLVELFISLDYIGSELEVYLQLHYCSVKMTHCYHQYFTVVRSSHFSQLYFNFFSQFLMLNPSAISVRVITLFLLHFICQNFFSFYLMHS